MVWVFSIMMMLNTDYHSPYHFFLWDLLGHRTRCRGNTLFLFRTLCICHGLASVRHIYSVCSLCPRNGKSSTLLTAHLVLATFFVLKRPKSYQTDTRTYPHLQRWFTSFSVFIIITIVNTSSASFTSGEKNINM